MALAVFLLTSLVLLPAQADSHANRLILVAGATGTQGGAVARELLRRGYGVRGLTRDPSSDRAVALTELGAKMVAGNFDDPASLQSAMRGAYGVFAVTDFWEHGYDKEVAHGRALVDAAENAGVKHFVYTSVAGADENTGVAHFDSKYDVEQYLAASDLTWSVIRPVSFMNNWYWRQDEIRSGSYIDPAEPEQRHQWIAAADIGFFAAEAFDQPESWARRAEDIAGDELTLAEFAALLSRVTGREVQHEQISWADYEAKNGEDMTTMHRWFAEHGYSVDIAALRTRYPGLQTAAQFLEAMDW
ncbi:MAG: NmrA/HSCARG family protein [Gammaproteobacteria bacterium]|nr:NmrA/HSCARG family protein [Gammaproteobacteria bacterium]